MRLIFDTGDDDAYGAAREALLGELHGWLERSDQERAETVADVGLFLDWRYHESTGVLDEFTPGEVAEFLLEWVPPRLTGQPDAAVSLCFAVGVYVDFMAATGRLIGGVERAVRLRRLADDLAPTVLAETREDDGDEPEPEPYELPFVYIPPDLAEVAEAAAGASLLTKIDVLRDYLGPDGKRLTDKGNVELDDGRALIELLDTGDEMDLHVGDEIWRTTSTATLHELNFILDVAIESGAVVVQQCRMVPVRAWALRSPVQRAEALFAATARLGPAESLCSGMLYPDGLLQLLDDAIVHLLAPLLAQENAAVPFESLLTIAEAVTSGQRRRYWPDEIDSFDEVAEEGIGRIVEVLEAAGVVRWAGREEVPQQFGRRYLTGGSVTLTALGRHVLPNYVDHAGYELRRVDGVADADGAALIEALLSVPDTQREAVVAAWRRELPAGDRAQILTEAIAGTADAASRIMGFVALGYLDLDAAEPFVRQLLDTPVAGHAALWLIAHERADASTLGSFVDVGVLVDMLAEKVDDPDDLCALFTSMSEPSELLESMWRHPARETAEVLDVLGRHMPDRALAKAARKAAVRHRSWIANRG
ncbi:hypothetical protein [Mycobacterium sp. Marseille-P9652]|uniref:hypothetical protein n=1 Tax=Mycobacterium sp. Marseille-P9652 TaxID=2654950 RepID=UPI0012E85127|nr:hypothetical protein [Mycobacterium sp. Marseille-P9652]